jgi:putative Holliday junction resolvase
VTRPPGSGPEGRGPGEPDVSGTLLGFDFGERRIGVAVGETATGIANPLTTIDARANEVRLEAVEKLVREWRPVAFVVGLPRHADGSEHPIARLAAKFARRLQARHGLPVRFIDETLTSAGAAQAIREAGGAPRKADLDAVSASIILQSYLDTRSRGAS